MQKTATKIEGLFILEFSPQADERGFFVRNHCEKDFAQLGLEAHFIQSSLSYNKKKGTLRGMHLQKSPHGETKLIQCLAGKIYDVILDLRLNSKTFKTWQSFELSLDKQQALYVPAGCAHGFISLTDDALIQYRMDTEFHAESQVGIRWDDPQFKMEWPAPPSVISEKDRAYSDFKI